MGFILRYTGVLWFFAVAEFALMAALELFLFRRNSGGRPSLDVRSTFSADDVSQWLAALGPQGAETILVWHYLTFDLLFPALFGGAILCSMVIMGRRLARFLAMPNWVQIVFAAVIVAPYVYFDYAQNWAVVKLLRAPFTADVLAVSSASRLTFLKWVSLALPVVVIALLALAGQKFERSGLKRGKHDE